jgi:polygalacturonase
VVRASLTSVERNSLAEADEAKLDTERIQRAIDGCKSGQAVELKADSAHDAFVSGPLALRPGITLLVAAKTILLASRNPRDSRPAVAAS